MSGAGADTESDFETYRRLLFSVAYRMLGSVVDAEDMVQETFLRWQSVDRGRVRSPKSFLTTVVTRLCIDHLRSTRVRLADEAQVELPEPLAAARVSRDEAELADSLSIAFLVMLQTLTPVERAAFLLREVLEYEYDEVAAVLGKTEVNCRQILRRAKERLSEGRRRFRASGEEAGRLVEQFGSVVAGGDVDTLVTLLAPDVTLYADGGGERPLYGKARAIRRPLRGAEVVARFLVSVQQQAPQDLSTRIERVNGDPAIVSYRSGRLVAVLSFEVSGGRIRSIFIQQDPAKQSGMGPLRFDA